MNLLVIGLLSVLQWNHMLHHSTCLNPNTDTGILRRNRVEAYIFPVLSAVAILLALVSIPWGIFIYFVAPVYMVLMWIRETRSHAAKKKTVRKLVKFS